MTNKETIRVVDQMLSSNIDTMKQFRNYYGAEIFTEIKAYFQTEVKAAIERNTKKGGE